MSFLGKSEFRKGALELALIFVGITLALAFENLNNDRARRTQELKLLSELVQDIEETQLDLDRDIQGVQRRLVRNEALLRWFNGDIDAWGNLTNEFSGIRSICNLPGMFPKTSAYESIKSAGLDLIANDTIRASIATFFELSLARVTKFQGDFLQNSTEYCLPFLIDHFRFVEEFSFDERNGQSIVPGQTVPMRVLVSTGMVPISPESLQQDHSARMVASIMYQSNSRVLAIYSEVNAEAEFLKSLIQEEIE